MQQKGFISFLRKLLPVAVFTLLLLLIVYIWLASVKYIPKLAAAYFPHINPNGVQTYGEVGELFGAVGSFFSAMAVFLLIFLFWKQRTDNRRYQRELSQLKSDQEISRLNNLIISQANRIEYLVETLTFQDLDGNEYEGVYGIDFLNASLPIQNIEKYRTGELEGKEEEILLVKNYKSIKRLLLSIAQSNQAIEDQIEISHIGQLEKEKLYAIYLRNVGASILVLLRKLESFTDIIINSDNTYAHKEMDFKNPIFILSELSAGFFHNIASNCQSELVMQIVPEPV